MSQSLFVFLDSSWSEEHEPYRKQVVFFISRYILLWDASSGSCNCGYEQLWGVGDGDVQLKGEEGSVWDMAWKLASFCLGHKSNN